MKSAVYDLDFDAHVLETHDKVVTIDYFLKKGDATLGKGRILEAACEEDRTTMLRGRMEIPNAEFEAMFKDGSGPSLVIVLTVKNH